MKPWSFKYSLGSQNEALELQMEPGISKRSLGASNGPWELKMEPWSFKWSLGDQNKALELQMELGSLK